jgi:hypothetical protein
LSATGGIVDAELSWRQFGRASRKMIRPTGQSVGQSPDVATSSMGLLTSVAMVFQRGEQFFVPVTVRACGVMFIWRRDVV